MNTKAYLKLFEFSLAEGQIPKDLYDEVVGWVNERGKMTPEIYRRYLDELEARRLFLADGTPFDKTNSAKTDGTFIYIKPKNPLWHFCHAVNSVIFKIAGWAGGALALGVWRVKDRKKLKGLKACISVSNHIDYIDTALTRRAFGSKKLYITAAPHNCKNTSGGRFLVSAGAIPFPTGIRGAKMFGEALSYHAKRGATIHFYAEQSMWFRYPKPRPYMDGAFYYADKLDLPVVPVFYCMKKPRGLRRLLHLPKYVIKMSDPVYINRELPVRERRKDLCDRVSAATKSMYESFYGVPLEYLPEKRDEEITDTTEVSEKNTEE